MNLSQPSSVNVLLNDANWAWPQAVSQIFQPRGINALVADSANDMVSIIDKNKIHLAILDAALDNLSGMRTLKIIRKHDKLLPCLLLAQNINHRLLEQALNLNVFSVLTKPVDLNLLANQINRIFRKYYASDIFSDKLENVSELNKINSPSKHTRKISTVIKWTMRKKP